MNFILVRRSLAFVGLAFWAAGAALAAAPGPAAATTPCPCDEAAPTAATAKHAINTKGTGTRNSRVAGATATPVPPATPAASSAEGWPKKSGHVTLNR